MKVVERVPHSLIRARTRKEPIKFRWVETLMWSGINKGKLVAKEFRRGSAIDGFTNFSATPLLELVKLIATAQWDRAAWLGQDVMMHTDIRRA